MEILMKNLWKLAIALPAVALMACSSMDVDNADSANWPSDFDAQTYATINPILFDLQLQDYIAAYNASWKTAQYASAANAIDSANVKTAMATAISADSAEFFADTANLHLLYSRYAGSTDTSDWSNPSDSIVKARNIYIYKYYNLYGKTVSEELSYIRDSVAVDLNAVKLQYTLYGQIEGRPYRYCKTGEAMTLRSLSQAASVTSTGLPDYRPNYYCCNAAEGSACTDDSQIYLIQQ
jgi:hypothetical protein